VLDGSFLEFFKKNPFWASFIIIFAVLPIVGAVVHILLKAFGRKGLDNTNPLSPEDDQVDQIPEDDVPPKPDKK
jgi:hypothetical protein